MSGTILTLRPATTADARLLLEWRNDQASRNSSRNSETITIDQHEAWLTCVLVSTDHVVRIAESSGVPVGVVRANRIAEGWELSWTVAPQSRGHGVGTHMLRAFAAHLAGPLTAVIRKSNQASQRIAVRAGLTLKGDAEDPDFEVWTRE
jgi:RimJ/RimL family protein N-acetyltransferase